MARDFIPDGIIALPRLPEGWFDHGYAALGSGELVLHRTDGCTQARLRWSTFDGGSESAAIEVPAGRWPKVDRPSDGRWLVVSDLAEPPHDINARFWAADGAPCGGFDIGDWMTRVRCAADGTVWDIVGSGNWRRISVAMLRAQASRDEFSVRRFCVVDDHSCSTIGRCILLRCAMRRARLTS